MPTHTALTIGPIYQTLQLAQSTRAIWAASYLFSHIVEQIAKELKADLEGQYVPDEANTIAAGLYTDRLVIRGKSKEEVQQIVQKALDDLWQKLAGANSSDNPLSSYIHVNIVELEEAETKSNVMDHAHQLLDATELQPFFNNESSNPVASLLQGLKEVASEEGGKDATTQYLKNVFNVAPKISSILDISAAELQKREVKILLDYFDGDEKTRKKVNSEQINPILKKLKNYHKYIAVVQADGDNIGATIKAIYDPATGKKDAIDQFAKTLFKNGQKAVQMIADYGGLPIYAGGDDLLFFAPIINGDQNIFGLLEDLSKLVEDNFKTQLFEDGTFNLAENKDLKVPTLSFGLSINYYKFPMAEAIERSGSLMFGTAKKVDGKNAVAAKLEKHSGTYFDFVYQLKKKEQEDDTDNKYKDESYGIFKKLLTSYNDELDSTSLIYMLYEQKGVIGAIHSLDRSKKKDQRLTNFFINRPGNDQKPLDDYTKNIVDLLALELRQHDYADVDYSEPYPITIKRVTDMLRTIKFLNQDSHA